MLQLQFEIRGGWYDSCRLRSVNEAINYVFGGKPTSLKYRLLKDGKCIWTSTQTQVTWKEGF